jgi:arylsulfatase B
MFHLILLVLLFIGQSFARPPNIIFIVTDDLGWNDVSFHGSPQILTPNIDNLAEDGVILDNYYATSACSPSRATILTGRHIIHTGMYTAPNYRTRNLNLNSSFSLLPTYLKNCCNYSSHIIGKWHLGFSNVSYLPTSRGFDSHFGFWYGVEDHSRHRIYGGYDFVDQLDVAHEYKGQYGDDLFADKAVEFLKDHATRSEEDNPFFLFLSFQNIHWPLQAPEEFVSLCENNTGNSFARKMVCAMGKQLDAAIGRVTTALDELKLWENTFLVFTSDNGGPTNRDEATESNNYPLRGGKNTLWQGGNRIPTIIKGKGIEKKNYSNKELFYAADWLPSLVSMASEGQGQDWQSFKPIDDPPFQVGDGLNLWSSLSKGDSSSRDFILLETHPKEAINRTRGDALILGDWKIVRVTDTLNNQMQDGWFAPPGEDFQTINYSIRCDSGASLKEGKSRPAGQCQSAWCLFNLREDPCEYHDVSRTNPAILQSLVEKLEEFQATAVLDEGVYDCLPALVTLEVGEQGGRQGGGEAGEAEETEQIWRPCDLLDPFPSRRRRAVV